MTDAQPLLRNISDTARWTAMYRAQETERPDALFRDPLAARLAGERGREIVKRMTEGQNNSWAFVMRTWLYDQMIGRCLAEGADTVVNLAAGLDTRPYRLDLPGSLRWIEVDLPGILDEKEEILAGETPRCRLERVRLDLSDVTARRELFARIDAEAKKVVVVSEGLIIYLSREQVAALATDLAAPASFRYWIVDPSSPGLLRMLQRSYSRDLEAAAAPLVFGPPEGPLFFEPYGWKPIEVQSLSRTAAKKGRLRFFMKLVTYLPQSSGRQGNAPWCGATLLERQ